VHAHLAAADDGITAVAPVLARHPRFAELIETGADAAAFERLRRAESIGRPLGDDAFLARLETVARRRLRPQKRGPKPSQPDGDAQGKLSGLSP
jgi:putative transposase